MSTILSVKPVLEELPFYIIRDSVAYLQERAEEQQLLNDSISPIEPEQVEEFDSQFLRDFEDDFSHLKNEREEVKLERIKRYRKVVDMLKDIYNGECQICGFAFMKNNDRNYSEAHHLDPLSLGGSQDEDNVVILCANHHRMLHYGKNVSIGDRIDNSRIVKVNDKELIIKY